MCRITITKSFFVSIWKFSIFMEQAIGDKSQFCRISSKTVSTLNALTNEGSMMFYMSKKFPFLVQNFMLSNVYCMKIPLFLQRPRPQGYRGAPKKQNVVTDVSIFGQKIIIWHARTPKIYRFSLLPIQKKI